MTHFEQWLSEVERIKEWYHNFGRRRNHYLYGEPPFDYPTYESWREAAGV